MAFDPEKHGAVEIFDPVAHGAVALQEPQPLEPKQAFDKAGETWDISVEQEIPLSDADRGFVDVQEVQRKHDSTLFWRGLYTPVGPIGPPPIHPVRILAEIAKGPARFLQRDIAGFGGRAVGWFGQFIQQGGAALDFWGKVGTKNKNQIYNPLAEAIIATGENITKFGLESRDIWVTKATTGWEAFDETLRETDPISYGAGRISESLTSSALAVLAAYLSGGATTGQLLVDYGIKINRGLVALSLLSAAGGFEHAQNQKENFYWSTVHGVADGAIEYAMESAFLKDIPGSTRFRAGLKESGEEFFTGMIQNTRAGILENSNKGMSAYEAAKTATVSSLSQSPWEMAAGFIGGYGVKGGADLVNLVQRGNQIPLEKPEIKAEKGAPVVEAPVKAKIVPPKAPQAKPEPAVKIGKPTVTKPAPDYGAQNTLVTTKEYEAIKARLAEAEPLKGKPKKGQRKGAARIFTPEDLVNVGKIGLYHFEAGTREFSAWSKRMVTEFGASIKPHLKKIWEDVEDQRVPGKERGFIASIKGALPQIKVEGQYIPRSTDELSIKARNLINDDIKQAENVALKGNTDKSVAVASELIKYYGEQADLAADETVKDAFYDKASVIASDAAAKLTELGRAVQAASILSRLTPEGQVRFAAREIQKYNEKIEKSKGGLFGLKKKISELTPKQAQEILTEMKAIDAMPPGTDKARRFQKLQNKISDMVPTSLFQKAISIWKAGLLTGIKTSGLNIFANTAHLATEKAAKIPATVLDKIVSIGTGERTVTVTMKGLGRGTVTGVKKGVDYLVTGYDERDIGTKLDYKRKSFGEGKVARALQTYTDTVFHILGAEDQPFYYSAKLMSLYEQSKVAAINEGLKGKEAQAFIDNMMDNPTEEMVKNASKDAESAVFQNKTSLGDLAKGIQGLGKGAGEIVVPFGRTPSAVAMQVVNYSPVGAVKTIIENIGKGKFNQRDFVTGLGRSIVGSIPIVIGIALLDNDMLTLDFPDTEKERKLWEIEGRKANSVKIDGKWRTIQSFGPAGNLLIVGGHFRRAFQESGSPTEAMATALTGSGKSFTEQTFLQGINQFTAALNDPERSGPRLARGLVSSVIPTIVGDVAKATDPLERRTGTIGERVRAKIPGVRQTLEPRITVLGEERKVTANPLEIMIDPTRPSKEIKSPVVKELRRLFDAGHKVTPSLLGNKEGFEVLTQKENTALWKRTGQIINESLNTIIANPNYKNWPDEAKAKVIDRVVDASKTAAKAEVVAKKIKGLTGNELIDKLVELNESGLVSSELFPTKEIERLRKGANK